MIEAVTIHHSHFTVVKMCNAETVTLQRFKRLLYTLGYFRVAKKLPTKSVTFQW